MEFWNSQAEQLEKKLLQHMPELMLHFLRTATDATINALAGEALPTSENTRASIIAHLAGRLARQNDVLRVSPEMAKAIIANCDQRIGITPGANDEGTPPKSRLGWTEVQS